MNFNYEWLLDIGFKEDDVIRMCKVYAESSIAFIFDEDLRYCYIDSLNAFEQHGFKKDRFLLDLLVGHTSSFMMTEKTVIERLDQLKDILGDRLVEIVMAEFFEEGFSDIIEYIGYLATSSWESALESLPKKSF